MLEVYRRTSDGEITRVVGLPSVILSEAGVQTLIVLGGVANLQSPVNHDRNSSEQKQNFNKNI